jgi:hypothetical protein
VIRWIEKIILSISSKIEFLHSQGQKPGGPTVIAIPRRVAEHVGIAHEGLQYVH